MLWQPDLCFAEGRSFCVYIEVWEGVHCNDIGFSLAEKLVLVQTVKYS